MDKSVFLNFLCLLEGYGTKTREFHWNTLNKAEHLLCDDIMDEMIDFKDNFAEEGFVIWGKFGLNQFKPVLETKTTNLQELLVIIEDKLIEIKKELTDIELCSLSALVDEFLHRIRKFILLSQMK